MDALVGWTSSCSGHGYIGNIHLIILQVWMFCLKGRADSMDVIIVWGWVLCLAKDARVAWTLSSCGHAASQDALAA